MEEKYFLFLKFGKKENLERLMKNGEIYFNNSENFNNLSLVNKEQGDKYEGAELIVNGLMKEIKCEHPSLGNFYFKPAGVFDLIQYNSKYLTCSFYKITSEDFVTDKDFKIDERMLEFNDYVLIIEEPFKLINLIKEKINFLKFDFQANKVRYIDFKKMETKSSIFDKKIEHDYQKEYRLVINNLDNKPKIINVGSIESFCRLVPSKLLLEANWKAIR